MADTKISALPASTTPLAGTEVLPIVQSGATKQVSVANLTAGRAVSAASVTASTGSFVVSTSGQGVDFSANSNAPGMTSEVLTWYEEGTWTPIDASGAGLSLTVNSATYTRIGRVVHAFAYIVYPSTASGANVVIGGLPFTTRGSNGGFQPFPVATDAAIGVYGYTAQNSTTASFYNNSTNAVVTNASLSTKYVLVAITYTT
jgi:hypothetical protein